MKDDAARARTIELLEIVGVPFRRAARRSVPARVLGRNAPARDDRDGDGEQPERPHRRRADDRARRHHPGADRRGASRRPRSDTHAAIILITHDLGLIAELADRVVVMYAGRVVEIGDVYTIFDSPRHPYTIGLMNSLARVDIDKERLEPIPGQPPSLISPPPGCAFHPRCIALARSRGVQDGDPGAPRDGRRRAGPPLRVPLRGGARRAARRRSQLPTRTHDERNGDRGRRRRSVAVACRVERTRPPAHRQPRQALPDQGGLLQAHRRAGASGRRRRRSAFAPGRRSASSGSRAAARRRSAGRS